jgi:hypothetical protein
MNPECFSITSDTFVIILILVFQHQQFMEDYWHPDRHIDIQDADACGDHWPEGSLLIAD